MLKQAQTQNGGKRETQALDGNSLALGGLVRGGKGINR